MSAHLSLQRGWAVASSAAVLLGALLAGHSTVAHAQRGVTRPEPASGVVNIQQASVDELQLLPGIGPSKAQAIVLHRERHAFRRVEDLMRVRGIGRATFRRLRPMLTVQGPTTLAPPATSASPQRDRRDDS